MVPPAKKIQSKAKISRLKSNKSQRISVDQKSSQHIEDVLSIPLILRIILENFSDCELIELSLMNKLWRHEALRVLRDRGLLIAHINSHHPCQALKAFASDLRQMSVVPFSGIKIDLRSYCICTYEQCAAFQAGELNPPNDAILARLHWKSLNVRFHFDYDNSQFCPAFGFVRKIFADFGGVLERLSLNIPADQAHFSQKFLKDRSFSRLRSLIFYSHPEDERKGCMDLISSMVSRAPHLDALHVYQRVDLEEISLVGTSLIFKTNYDISPTVQEIPESLVHLFRMPRVRLREVRPDLSLERCMVTPLLLDLSRGVLKSMDLDAAFLVPLMGYKICLENVTDFRMHFNSLEPYQPRISSLIKIFDFNQIFPRLTRVQCFGRTETNAILQSQIMHFIEEWNLSVSMPRPDRASNKIKELTLNLPDADSAAAQFLPKMFPHVEKLSVSVSCGPMIPRLILEGPWKDLKELEVEEVESNRSRNWNLNSIFVDSIFNKY